MCLDNFTPENLHVLFTKLIEARNIEKRTYCRRPSISEERDRAYSLVFHMQPEDIGHP